MKMCNVCSFEFLCSMWVFGVNSRFLGSNIVEEQ